MKAKKALTIAVAAVSVASVFLTACSSKDSNTTSPQASNAAQSKSDLKPYKITMFVPGVGAPKDQALVNEEISKYLKDKINASFELTVIDWGSWQDKMNLKIAGSEPFDLMWTTDWDNYSTRVQQGVFLPVNDLLDKYGQDIKKLVPPAIMDGGKMPGDDKNYGVPVNKEFGTQKGVMVRKDLVDKYKMDLSKVKKPEDLEPLFEIIKKSEPGVTPFYSNKSVNLFNMVSQNYFDGVNGSVAIDRNSTDYKVFNQFADPRTKQILDLTRKWYQAGYINQDAATLQDIAGGIKAGKAFAFEEYLKPGKDAEDSLNYGNQWIQVPFTDVVIGTGDSKGNMMSISRTAKDPERDMMFLNLLYTDKTLLNMLVFGIEGKHYVKVPGKDNTIDFPQGVDAKTSGYSLGSAYMFGNQFNDYLFANEDPQKWEKFKQFNTSAKPSKMMGFAFNVDSVKNEVAAYSNVEKEFVPGLYTGAVDPNEVLPKFLEKIKSSGGDKILAEAQKQLDDWVKKNGKK